MYVFVYVCICVCAGTQSRISVKLLACDRLNIYLSTDLTGSRGRTPLRAQACIERGEAGEGAQWTA